MADEREPDRPIFLHGPPAIGKTTLARVLRGRGLQASQASDDDCTEGAFHVLLWPEGADADYDTVAAHDLALHVPCPPLSDVDESKHMWEQRADTVCAALTQR